MREKRTRAGCAETLRGEAAGHREVTRRRTAARSMGRLLESIRSGYIQAPPECYVESRGFDWKRAGVERERVWEAKLAAIKNVVETCSAGQLTPVTMTLTCSRSAGQLTPVTVTLTCCSAGHLTCSCSAGQLTPVTLTCSAGHLKLTRGDHPRIPASHREKVVQMLPNPSRSVVRLDVCIPPRVRSSLFCRKK